MAIEIAPAPKAKCGCLECRVRAALYGGEITAPFEIDTNEAIKALANVMAELLAHHSSKSAKLLAAAHMRPRSFLWVETSCGPAPQIVFNDPRVGCDDLTIISEKKLEPGDTRSLDDLIKTFPAPSTERA